MSSETERKKEANGAGTESRPEDPGAEPRSGAGSTGARPDGGKPRGTTTADRTGNDSGRLSRLATETKGLVEDVKTWVDLKLELFEFEIQDRIEAAANKVAVSAALAFLAFLTLVFGLVTGALALGSWWESDTLGFLAVTCLLLLITVLIYVLRPRFIRRKKESAEPDELPPALPEAPDRPRLSEAHHPDEATRE